MENSNCGFLLCVFLCNIRGGVKVYIERCFFGFFFNVLLLLKLEWSSLLGVYFLVTWFPLILLIMGFFSFAYYMFLMS